jgi:diguanylate cyclase (GGDEF)-like protein
VSDKIQEFETDAAFKANETLGDVVDGETHLLSTSEKGTEILTTFERAELSNVDALTGVGNSRAQEIFFTEDENRQKAIHEVKTERRTTGPLFPTSGLVLYMDTDNLKEVNYLSRKLGDELIQKVAKAAKSVAQRDYDQVFRQGGDGADEFSVVLPGMNRELMEQVVFKFNQSLKALSTEREATASLAIGEYGNGKTVRQTVSELDKALSDAKKNREIRGSHVDTVFQRLK